MFLNISYLLPMTMHYDAIAKAADEDARQRRQLESTIAETTRKLTSLEQRYQLTLSRILAFSEAKQKIDQIIRLVEISDAVLLKADYHTQPLTQIPSENTETELFTHHLQLQLHLHMPFHHWQQIKQLIFEHTPQNSGIFRYRTAMALYPPSPQRLCKAVCIFRHIWKT